MAYLTEARLAQADGRQRLTMERRFPHPPSRVWQHLVDPGLLSQWHPATVTSLQPKVGGTLELDYGDGATTTARITEWVPEQRLGYVEAALEDMPRESDNSFGITLEPDADGCWVVFTHDFDDRAAAASYAAGWDACFDLLGDMLDGRDSDRQMPSVEHYEEYVREFGLDNPVIGNDQLRIERQLMLQPPEKVWRMLAPTTLEWLAPGRLGAGMIVSRVDGESVDVELASGERLRWEVGSGPGGARITLIHSPVAGNADDLRLRWRDHVERLVERVNAAS
ncbi:SRPBCC domain-containing protein [Diaminobutyricimonas sp. TR449]|uniref:SRPBCC domain-containing protein n=1 Tax=Diaminobutyricimonas sp. TR449 TaxID=2708076 RepID=UPI00142409BD|nr:SRPBCC domain-containing protein [Diaminobutyricimonas sp. TR449]